MKTLIIIPTYNELENLPLLLGKVLAAKERHEGGSKGQETLIKRLERGFSTHRISDEDGDKVKCVIATKPGAGKWPNLSSGPIKARL